jgi:hypothetical protein
MYCTEREHLIARYETVSREFSKAVLSLSGKRSVEFEKAYQDTERLRTACEEARIALERHSFHHGCALADAATKGT